MTGDARPRFFESYALNLLTGDAGARARGPVGYQPTMNLTLCSRSRCGAREAMTVGCKPTSIGAIYKGRPHPRGRGEGGLVKSGHMRTQGGGGQWQKVDVLKFKFFLPKF